MKLFKGSPFWMFLLSWLPACSGEGFLIKNVRLGQCLHVSPHETEKIGLSDCKPHLPQFQWGWDAASRAIVSLKTRQCLAVQKPQEFAAAQLEPCGDHGHQSWVCSKKGHLSLQGLGLHLSTQLGGHKAFLSGEKDKFSRWKTWMDEIVCTAGLAVPRRKPVVPWEQVPQSETIRGEIATSSGTPTFLGDPTTTSSTSATLEADLDLNSTLPRRDGISLAPEEETHTPRKHAGHHRKIAGARTSGTNWKTMMLILSPLAFILGLIILGLNIHYNKKKKRMLSGPKRYPEKSHPVNYEERLPFSGTPSAGHQTPTILSSPSPSLKHGEILIEWKDGTITPLFDNMSYPIC
ncbi:uncharacterized protein LOC143841993 isoform X2 [Paroedura picta]|uniref:uncharacterized protein LOC143841993 isoform X2 n=1 Tax=Paroedura picta TaxID=143630 RepID=UPI0040576614